jgi:hypothetical protein
VQRDKDWQRRSLKPVDISAISRAKHFQVLLAFGCGQTDHR